MTHGARQQQGRGEHTESAAGGGVHPHHPHHHGHAHDDRDHPGDRHEHGNGLGTRLRHVVSELTGGHSHDAADQVDDALEADARGRRALLISLAALAATARCRRSSSCSRGRSRCSATRCTTSPTR